MSQKNVMVAQSGGPTVAINASLAGVIEGVQASHAYDTVYGSINGILGILNDHFLNLWSDEENRFTAMHHPFTMPMDEDLPLLDTDPGAVRAKAYDIVLNGTEIGGGSVRIHQNDVQEKMFEMLGFTKEQAHERFGFLLDAFKYGVPPHAGLAYGLDRLVMLMAKEDSIRDVIAFPKVKDASCLMTEAPSPVDAAQLEELGLEVELQAEEETTEE